MYIHGQYIGTRCTVVVDNCELVHLALAKSYQPLPYKWKKVLRRHLQYCMYMTVMCVVMWYN